MLARKGPSAFGHKNVTTCRNAGEVFDTYLNATFANARLEWPETTLGEIATFKNGLNFTKASRGEAIKIVGGKDFQRNFRFSHNELETVQIDGSLGRE